jgi:hypothetical protein
LSRLLFSTGSARGGTNLITKAISVREDALVICDPMLAMFKSLRSAAIRKRLNIDIDPEASLADYYYLDDLRLQKWATYEASLDLEFQGDETKILHNSLRRRMSLTCQNGIRFVEQWEGKTYLELFDKAFNCLKAAFGKSDASLFGVNENWAIEFFPALAKAYPESMFMVIVRDPRAAACSALLQKDKNRIAPILSFCRGWRKNIAYIEQFKKDATFKNRLLVIRYEDLVHQPREYFNLILEKFHLEFRDSMADSRNYKDGKGKGWRANSHVHAKINPGIFTDSISAWRTRMEKDAIAAVEFICAPEMRLHDYVPVFCEDGVLSQETSAYLEKNDQQRSSWRSSSASLECELENEINRYNMLRSPAKMSIQDQERSFLFASAFEALTSANRSS